MERPLTEENLALLLEALDLLHTAASDDDVATVTSMNRRELAAWLRDVVYTATETLAELDESAPRTQAPLLHIMDKLPEKPALRLVAKPSA